MHFLVQEDIFYQQIEEKHRKGALNAKNEVLHLLMKSYCPLDNYRYSISREELHERIEQGRQALREGRCVPLDDAFIERMKKIADGVRNGTVKATG